MKQTIIDDYGKEFVTHIQKYKEFCNVPDHINYQEVLDNCYNLYFPFEHDPEPGDTTYTISFLKHIFGNNEIKVKVTDKGVTKELCVNELDLGLDYIQLLYQKPQQVLPILCLVSKENGTGKSTLVKWLKMIFTQNVAIVGNADLANDFNASWAGKLIVACEEAKIDKTVVVEKVKALSTGDKIFMNAKGKDHVEIEFFAKFIFNTNNEDNFIYASEDDVRYWVRKVPVVKELFVGLIKEMKEEIPAFLDFLNKRKLATQEMHRAWFHPELIKTEALKKVIDFSKSTVEKELRENFRTMFFEHGGHEYLMTLDAIRETFFKGKNYEIKYLRNVLTDKLRLKPYSEFLYNGIWYKSIDAIKKVVGDDFDSKLVKEQFKPKRHTYPKYERNGNERKRVLVSDNGRPFVIPIDKFLHPDEIQTRWVDAEADHDFKMVEAENEKLATAGPGSQLELVGDEKKDDLPF